MPTPLSVVLATYNRRPILERTLDALGGQTQRDFQTVVVDDGSEDDTWLSKRLLHRMLLVGYYLGLEAESLDPSGGAA